MPFFTQKHKHARTPSRPGYDNEDPENLVPAQIKSSGVEDILVDMGILERGEEWQKVGNMRMRVLVGGISRLR